MLFASYALYPVATECQRLEVVADTVKCAMAQHRTQGVVLIDPFVQVLVAVSYTHLDVYKRQQ